RSGHEGDESFLSGGAVGKIRPGTDAVRGELSIIDKFRKSRYGEMAVLILSFPFKRGAWPPFPSTISIKTGSAANGRCPLPTEPRAPTSPPRSVSGEDRGPCHGIRRGNGEKFYAPITRSLDPLSQYHTNLQEAVPILPQLGKKRGIPVSCARLPLPLDRQRRSLRCPQHIRSVVVPTFEGQSHAASAALFLMDASAKRIISSDDVWPYRAEIAERATLCEDAYEQGVSHLKQDAWQRSPLLKEICPVQVQTRYRE